MQTRRSHPDTAKVSHHNGYQGDAPYLHKADPSSVDQSNFASGRLLGKFYKLCNYASHVLTFLTPIMQGRKYCFIGDNFFYLSLFLFLPLFLKIQIPPIFSLLLQRKKEKRKKKGKKKRQMLDQPRKRQGV